MYDPNNPQGQVPGMMQTMGAPVLGAGPKPANSYDMQQGLNALHGGNWRDAWHEQRPDRGAFDNPMDWRNALMGWRGMKRDFKFGMPAQPAAAPPMAAPPQTIPTPPPNYQLPVYQYGG